MRGPRNTGDGGFIAAFTLILVLLVLQFAFWGALIYVALHFILKLW